MDRLDAMRAFVRVAELGSFAAVARQRDVARSVITRQVAALERHLGVKLLLRSTRRLALTGAGQAYARQARDILALVDAAESGAAEEKAVPEGRIRLGLPLSFGVQRVAPLLLDFAARHPRVDLEMDFTDRRIDLVEEGYDLGVRLTRRLSPQDVVRRLGQCRLLTVASPAYLARRGRPTQPAQLADHDTLSYAGDGSRNAWVYGEGEREHAWPVRSRLCAGNGEVLAQAAVRGLGIALLPEFIVAADVAAGRLEVILARHAPAPLGIHAMLPGRGPLPLRVRLLLEHLAAGLRDGEVRTAGGGGRRPRASPP